MKIEVRGPIVSDHVKRIYDWFGLPATSPSVIKNAISRARKGEALEVVINSGGGSVFDGSDIYTTLKDYDGDVVVKIVGIAASAASVIAMAGTKVMMSPTAQIMIHNSAMTTRGNHSELNSDAEFLKRVDKTIASAYEIKTGMEQGKLLALMSKETWMDSKEALENKFIDEVMFTDNKVVASINIGINNDGTLPQEVISKMINQMAFENSKNNKRHTHSAEIPQDCGSDIKKINQEDRMTLEELKNNHPELYNQVKDEESANETNENAIKEATNKAIIAERKRVESLENLKNIPGANSIVEEAIKNGDSVEKTTIKIANSEDIKNSGKANQENKNFKNDQSEGGADNLSDGYNEKKEDKEDLEARGLIEKMSKLKNNMYGGR